MKPGELLAEFGKKNLRALSRLISLAENRDASVRPMLAKLFPQAGKAKVLGITGPPGAGKSTLVGELVREIRSQAKTVAVIAVDPVSPLTGGSLLGDRIRLSEHFNDPGVFIRSLSTRGKLGGLSQATREAVHLADAFGFDYVVVETVGVGQSEVEIRGLADVSVVVMNPESGDDIQTLKAGLLEIGDIFLVNKADREGADRMVVELRNMLELAHRPQTQVLSTSSKDTGSYRAWFAALETFFVGQSKLIQERRAASVRAAAETLLESALMLEARAWVVRHVGNEKNPYEFIERFLASHSLKDLFRG